MAVAEGVSVNQLLNSWEEELKTATSYETVEDFLASLRDEVAKTPKSDL